MPEENDIERLKLEIERDRIKSDAALREREAAIKEREVAIKEAESTRLSGYFPEFLKSPFTLAAVGLMGTAFGAGFQGFWNLRLEQQKFESEMIKVALQEKTQQEKANFLNFLKSTQIVTLFNLQNVDALAEQGKLPNVSQNPEIPSVPARPLLERLRSRLPVARLIASRFADAGYGKFQQIAAVAVAIRESNLNPGAHSTADGSVGLFQLSLRGGLGTGFSVEQLSDPDTNIQITIKESMRYADFREATSIEVAVNVFIRKIDRPANPDDFVRITIGIARAIQALENEWFPSANP